MCFYCNKKGISVFPAITLSRKCILKILYSNHGRTQLLSPSWGGGGSQICSSCLLRGTFFKTYNIVRHAIWAKRGGIAAFPAVPLGYVHDSIIMAYCMYTEIRSKKQSCNVVTTLIQGVSIQLIFIAPFFYNSVKCK